ncbi:aldehyde dehydrogenase [Meredithblackwellia eburnea MCA 4105]
MMIPTVETRLFINNEFVDASNKETFEVYNPYTEKLAAKVASAQKKDVDLAVEAAAAAQPGWDAISPSKRAEYMHKLADLLLDPVHLAEIERLEAMTMGAPASLTKTHTILAASRLKYFAALGLNRNGRTSLNTPGFVNITFRQPFGVVAGILPWNVTLPGFASKAGPAIAAGNTIVIKLSEKAPLGLLYVSKLIVESGFPPGVTNVLPGLGHVAGDALARHMKVRQISFTGSGPTGRLISKAAAESNLKNITLELGGKSPSLVFADANLPKAAKALATSAWRNSAQICTVQSRIYVHQTIADQFVDLYCKEWGNLVTYSADENDKKGSQGPIVDRVQFERVMGFIEEAKGYCTLVMGGKRAGNKGYFVEPTVFIDVPANARINQEEVFGPAIVIHKFNSEEEVLKQANDTEFGLSSSIFTRDISRAMRVAKLLEAGNVSINVQNVEALDIPIGGVKGSGIGRESGSDALHYWTEERAIYMALD